MASNKITNKTGTLMMKRLLTTLATLLSLALFDAALAEGDAAKGEKVFKKCKACHAVGEGAKNKVGPQLNNLFGRTAGTAEGFKYSKAVIAKGEEGLVWTEETLAEYLKKPKKYIPKNKMAFGGLKKDADLENINAYLKQFSEGDQSSAPADDTKDMAAKPEKPAEEAMAEENPEFSEAVLNNDEIITAGGEIWGSQCRHCHGKNAYPGKAPKLKPRKYKPDFVFDRVTNGFRKMPAWKDVYSVDERVAIVAYVKSKKFSP
jgi:cytochrome c